MPEPAELGVFSGPYWMKDLAAAVRSSGACTTFVCTTCGASPLRQALVLSAEKAVGSTTGEGLSWPISIDARLSDDDVLQELVAQVIYLDARSGDLVQFVLRALLASGKQKFSSRLEELLGNSYAADALRSMKARFEVARERHRKHAAFNSPAAIEERKRLRAEERRRRMAARADRKMEIDKVRRSDQRFVVIRRIKHRQVILYRKSSNSLELVFLSGKRAATL